MVLEGVTGGPKLNVGDLVIKWTLIDLQLFHLVTFYTLKSKIE